MAPDADVCLIVEGGYPYVLGGVASWMDAYMRASPERDFHVVAISIASQPRIRKYPIADNVVGITDVLIDICPKGRAPKARDGERIARGVSLLRAALTDGNKTSFAELIELIRWTGFGQAALLDSKQSWTAMERVYQELLPDGPLVDFFWTWRFLARSLLSVVSTKLPNARVFHAVSTGYAGILGACAKHLTGRPYVVTEHGIYTNERRIELSVADWIFDSGASGFTVGHQPTRLRDVWLTAFTAFSRIAYKYADAITTQYRANQQYQRGDGAPEDRLRIIPNGIDVDLYAGVHHATEPRPPTVLMIGRIVPIKDIRTFIMAISLLREMVPNVVAILIGPEEEDPSYAAGCRALVAQLGLEPVVRFLGRVPDVMDYLGQADVIALTSISEAQPIALLEAAATGLPAVTTDVGSCREIIEGFADDPVIGRGGIVVDACDPKATAEALAAILRDDKMRAEMGQVMRRRIPNLYHKDRVKRLYDDLYNELMRAPRVEADSVVPGDIASGVSRRGKKWWPARHRPEYAECPGIGTTIERMTRQRSMSTIVTAYVYAAVLVAGPWIFTMLGIVGLSAAGCSSGCDELVLFRSIVIYNSLFSLVVSSPLAFFSGRYIADKLHGGQIQSAFFVFTLSLTVFCVTVLATVVPFYLVAATLDGPVAFAAIQNAFLIGTSWLLIPFLSVMKAHRAMLIAFGSNALLMIVLGSLLSDPSAGVLLGAFNVSFAITDVILVGTVARTFGTRITPDWTLLKRPPRHWELPLAGLAYAVGIWADKVVMWFGAPSGVLELAGALRTMPAYDTAMFWAQLASIPVIAVAFVHVEPRLSRLSGRFYGRLDRHASRRELTGVTRDLRGRVIASVVMLFVALAIVATMTILISFVFMNELGLRPTYMSILRVALWAMAFHTSAMFCFIFLLWFDLRRPALLVTAAYAVLNPALTILILPLGQKYYGYGTMIAAAATLLLAFAILLRELPWLHYHAFITNNTSL